MSTRPTIRALGDLGLPFPGLDTDLSQLTHPLIVEAQRVPAMAAAEGAERVVSIDDEVWLKAKVSFYRGAVGELHTDTEYGPGTEAGLPATGWWLVAGGQRKSDTPRQDFYAALRAECERRAKGMHQDVSSVHLKPVQDDFRRWQLEAAAQTVIALKKMVREVIARSAQTGAAWECTVDQFQIKALLRNEGEEAYLALSATGFWDYKIVAILLSAVPGVDAEDWQVEPSEVMGIEPEAGQVIYSTLLTPKNLSDILESVDDHFL